MKKTIESDPFLEKRLVKYDEWLSKGQISFASHVIAVSESLEPQQWVLPTERVMAILRQARSVAVQTCL
ncbi:MAG: hypothetical protein HQK55_15545, partial [Deltaproteobacteria bacterium]|nr:hypothetical protein [Deltaproteobacteria bacterium]